MATVEFTLKSVALSLYEIYGFHNKRSERVLQDTLDRVSAFTKKYEAEFVNSAMNEMCRGYNLNITLIDKEH